LPASYQERSDGWFLNKVHSVSSLFIVQVLPGLATQLAELLAAYLAHTSLRLLPAGELLHAVYFSQQVTVIQQGSRISVTRHCDASEWW
jgi:hypothetical protein